MKLILHIITLCALIATGCTTDKDILTLLDHSEQIQKENDIAELSYIPFFYDMKDGDLVDNADGSYSLRGGIRQSMPTSAVEKSWRHCSLSLPPVPVSALRRP